MKKVKIAFLAFTLATSLVVLSSFLQPAGKPGTDTTVENQIQSTGAKTQLLAPWDYVMDWRYGRTCSPGGGICFQNEDGDIFDYWNYSVSTGDVPGDNGTDSEVGPMYLRVEDGRLHVIFCRSIESNRFSVDNDIRLSDRLQQALGSKFTIKAGTYSVDYRTYKKYGEAFLTIY
jgi:hypothetical protein